MPSDQDRLDAIREPRPGDQWERSGEFRVVAKTFVAGDKRVPTWVAPAGHLFNRVSVPNRQQYAAWCRNATLIRRGA